MPSHTNTPCVAAYSFFIHSRTRLPWISKMVTFKDSFGPSLFYNKNIKIKYVNVYTDFKGFFEITENI